MSGGAGKASFLYLLSTVSLFACNNGARDNGYVRVADSSIAAGKILAGKYCQSCHSLPDPSLASVTTWYYGILPQMGPRLGIFRYVNQSYPSQRADRRLPSDYYPSRPLITDQEWQHIIDYYCSNAPDTLIGKDPPAIEKQLPQFQTISSPAFSPVSATSFVKIDSAGGGSILIADALKNKIFRYNASLALSDSLAVPGPLVGLEQTGKKEWIGCDIGILNPNNGRFGKMEGFGEDSGRWVPGKVRLLSDSLRRPVGFSRADLDGDGRQDLVVCEFGNLLGGLSLLRNTGNDHYERTLLSQRPGTIRAVIDDYNHDGKPDIWALFSQGDEGIALFTNLGGGKFSEKNILRFPPIYGSSYFELDDFNKDGFPDILYTCGDNADFSPVFKPYHGIYIYLNDGKNNFRQAFFFPQDGTYKAMARDFDGDGDLDIAAIAFFPDFIHRPEEGFAYLENQGDLRFRAFSSPAVTRGRWLTMDVGDINADGKPDIVLGNFSIAPAMSPNHPDWGSQPPFLLLTNTYR